MIRFRSYALLEQLDIDLGHILLQLPNVAGHVLLQLLNVSGHVPLELLDLVAQSVDPVAHDLAAVPLDGELLFDMEDEQDDTDHQAADQHQGDAEQEVSLVISFPLARICVSTIGAVPTWFRLQMLTIHIRIDELSLHG